MHSTSFSQSNLEPLRKKYIEAEHNAFIHKQLIDDLKKMGDGALAKGYLGAVTMMGANFKLNPFSKYQLFLDGKSLLEEALKKDPDNVELRYIRFSVQNKTPQFLGYSANKDADKAALFHYLQQSTSDDDEHLRAIITDYLASLGLIEG